MNLIFKIRKVVELSGFPAYTVNLCETPILNDKRFRQYIRLYKRFIDDLFLIWTGPADVLCEF